MFRSLRGSPGGKKIIKSDSVILHVPQAGTFFKKKLWDVSFKKSE